MKSSYFVKRSHLISGLYIMLMTDNQRQEIAKKLINLAVRVLDKQQISNIKITSCCSPPSSKSLHQIHINLKRCLKTASIELMNSNACRPEHINQTLKFKSVEFTKPTLCWAVCWPEWALGGLETLQAVHPRTYLHRLKLWNQISWTSNNLDLMSSLERS